MKHFNKVLLGCAALASIVVAGSGTSNVSAAQACIGSGANCNTPTTVTVSILPGDICIGSEGLFNFGSYTVSTAAQIVSGTFADYFWVEDMKGINSGYYTTLQMSGNLQGPGTGTIPGANVAVRANAGITTLSGSANAKVIVNATVAGGFVPLNTSVTFIQRTTATNNGVIGRYGTKPTLQLNIPAFQAVGQYTGTLVYTLYEY